MGSRLSLGAWILFAVLAAGSLAAGFGAGQWWQSRDVAPETARWVLAHSAESAQLTPASKGLFTLTMSPVDGQVLAVREDVPSESRLIPALRLESEWQEMFGDGSIIVTLLAAEPVVDGDMVTYPVEVLEPTFIAEDGDLRAFTEVTLVLPDAVRAVQGD